MANNSDWGQSDFGTFLFGLGGRGIFGFPADNPTVAIAVRVLRPYHDTVRKKQPVDYANGGDIYVYNKGLTEYTFGASLRLSRSEKAALKAFYDNNANGKANQVYYADPEGNEHIVRIMNDEFDFPEEAWNKFTGTLNLRKEG